MKPAKATAPGTHTSGSARTPRKGSAPQRSQGKSINTPRGTWDTTIAAWIPRGISRSRASWIVGDRLARRVARAAAPARGGSLRRQRARGGAPQGRRRRGSRLDGSQSVGFSIPRLAPHSPQTPDASPAGATRTRCESRTGMNGAIERRRSVRDSSRDANDVDPARTRDRVAFVLAVERVRRSAPASSPRPLGKMLRLDLLDESPNHTSRYGCGARRGHVWIGRAGAQQSLEHPQRMPTELRSGGSREENPLPYVSFESFVTDDGDLWIEIYNFKPNEAVSASPTALSFASPRAQRDGN